MSNPNSMDNMATYKSVMLIDDNEIDNIINEKIIEANSFADNILVFQTGQEALDFLNTNQNDEDVLPEIVFLDINMPIMDGFQFLEDFEKFSETVLEKCKIIMLSSSISPKDIDRAASSKYVKKYLNKPLNARYLEAITV
ncbi:MAG: response regulator [Bacteroidia bacterium]|nr:response regulator [Bacteroidia bacterium]